MAQDTIRIEDLGAPVLTDVQRLALDYGEARPVELRADAVLDAAVARTGLSDFGPEDFVERLALWLDEIDSDTDRTGLGRLSIFNDCVRYASNRLLVHDLLLRHPEIVDVEIRRPIIVAGLPRSGTTHLLNLMASDARLRSLPLWESYEPVPLPGEGRGPGGVDPRHERCRKAWEGMLATAPLVAAMHPMEPDHIHEEIELQLPDFSSYTLEWVARVPGWRDYYLSHDQTPHYRYMKRVLQILQWLRPRERWVLKSPQHLEQFGPLLSTFPDATIVVTHRDPVSVIQSAATMMTYSARINYRTPEPGYYLDYWTDRVERLLRRSVQDEAVIPGSQRVDVLFHEFMADDMATVERIYDTAGFALTDACRRGMAQFLMRHRRGRNGQVVYDLRQDFGAEPSAIRERFSFYFERFGVVEEVR